jgi:predicted helicase
MPKKNLRNITKLTDLISYLRDELEWPLESDDIDDLTYKYEPEHLGIDSTKVPKIKEIKQIKRISSKQPFGIFWVDFDNKNLPIVVMRRILQGLVKTNKGRAKASDLAAWDLHDLLFISSFGEKDHREISFAHFSEPENRQYGDLPTLRVLGWDAQDTVLKLEYVEKTLQSKLKWPDESIDPKLWRENWAKAFELRPREIIQTSERLAVLLADLARNIRNRAEKILEVENKNGVLKKLHLAFKEALIHDLTENDFADTYAQTIAYGLLAARVSRPSGIIADNVSDMVPITNPFLKEMLETFLKAGGRKGKMDFDELGVQEVVDLLNSDTTKMELVLKDFGNRTRQEDPVIHFYELFLKEYDKAKKVERGVFYTPHPVVSFIVRSVHEVLQKEFGLEDGLASTITWKEFAKLNKVEIPKGVTPDSPFVLILDPATGTATFLVEVIDIIYKTMCAKWEASGKKKEISKLWNEYVPKHLLPRLYGFELMMAPYAIAHMKIGLKLQETGYLFQSTERVRVYLTNALEPAQDLSEKFASFFPALAHEADAVNQVKTNVRFTVVVGNPPYLGEAGRGGDWIANLMRGKDTVTGKSTENYFEIDGKSLGEANPKWLNDLYVKFIRLSEYTLEKSNIGILGFITNHSYLDNPTFRGMRQSLMNTFSNIHIIDLHGNSKKKEKSPDGSKDENVFDIQQGTAIVICSLDKLLYPASGNQNQIINHFNSFGSRELKSSLLLENSLYNVKFIKISPNNPFLLFVNQDKGKESEYQNYILIKNVTDINVLGFQTHRDPVAIADTREELEKQIKEFLGKINKSLKESIDLCTFRPFDIKYVTFSKEINDRPRPELIQHVLRKRNISLLLIRQMQDNVVYSHVLVSTLPAIDRVFSCSRGAASVFPLYLYPSSDDMFQTERKPNFTKEFLDLFSNFSLPTSNFELSIFRYIYAVFHSPTYRERYAEFLKIDFPRVPISKTKELFQELSSLGNDLIALHLLQEEDSELVSVANLKKNRGIQFASPKDYKFKSSSKGKSESIVEKGYPKYENENVYVNEADYFEFVPEEVWNFHIGGYQVLHKWLKDRRERALSDEDVLHYRKVIVSLRETIVIMREVDEVVTRFGGFPDAFEG